MCFRHVLSAEAFENQDSTTVADSTWDYRRNTSLHVISIVIVLRIELRLFYLARTVVVARCASDTCFRKEAFENQDSTTVAYSTWDYRRNASIQEFSVVLVLIIKMRLFYLTSTMVVARCASGTCFLQKRSRTRIPPPLLAKHGIINEIPHSRTVVVARCASDTCFRIEAFENQDSTTVAYSTRDYRRNTSFEVFSIVIVLRTELRLFYVSRTVVVARSASNMCFRTEALEYQDPTNVTYSTLDYRRNASIPEFPVLLVLIIKMRLFYLSSVMVVARCASDTCFLQKRSRTRIPPPLPTQHGNIDEMPQYKSFLLYQC
ncbi:hypothetical protein ANTQUA_LOCUS6940 [Anthophora quadrimaculata]